MPDLYLWNGVSPIPLMSCFAATVFLSSVLACKAKYDWECRAELAEKQLKLIEREKELLDKDQTVSTLREEVSILFNSNAAVYVLWSDAGLLLDV